MVVNAILIVSQVNMTGKVLVFRLYSRLNVTAESTIGDQMEAWSF